MLVKSLQSTLAFIKEQDARHRDDKVLLLHRPKQAEAPPAASAPLAPPAEERVSAGLTPRVHSGCSARPIHVNSRVHRLCRRCELAIRVVPRAAKAGMAGTRGDAVLVRLGGRAGRRRGQRRARGHPGAGARPSPPRHDHHRRRQLPHQAGPPRGGLQRRRPCAGSGSNPSAHLSGRSNRSLIRWKPAHTTGVWADGIANSRELWGYAHNPLELRASSAQTPVRMHRLPSDPRAVEDDHSSETEGSAITADFLIEDADLVATCAGPAPRRGPAQRDDRGDRARVGGQPRRPHRLRRARGRVPPRASR